MNLSFNHELEERLRHAVRLHHTAVVIINQKSAVSYLDSVLGSGFVKRSELPQVHGVNAGSMLNTEELYSSQETFNLS